MIKSEKMVKVQLTSKLGEVPTFVGRHIFDQALKKANQMADLIWTSSRKLNDVAHDDEKELLAALSRVTDIRTAIRDIDFMLADSQDILQGLVKLTNATEEVLEVPEIKE